MGAPPPFHSNRNFRKLESAAIYMRSLKLERCHYFGSTPHPTLLLSSVAIAVILSPKSNYLSLVCKSSACIDARVNHVGGFAPPPPIRTSPNVISCMTSSRGQVAWVD
ncbi:hypothetical protein TNIN_48771 [Trichonephila inaurata madagascariensis]|uniref:Uncharacterized protein n=1 Tax=Trichonephila inaurata madagascariensis TaxID=2747483 RepID=A0A8X7C799_9ARAC|nr:hypothetical protein TNIN_48771 [Trichonephila inaurata madagascariensis]